MLWTFIEVIMLVLTVPTNFDAGSRKVTAMEKATISMSRDLADKMKIVAAKTLAGLRVRMEGGGLTLEATQITFRIGDQSIEFRVNHDGTLHGDSRMTTTSPRVEKEKR